MAKLKKDLFLEAWQGGFFCFIFVSVWMDVDVLND